MGLILAPDEIKTNMEVLRCYLNSMTECYQNVLERVYEYCDEEALDTESFRKSKNQMEICYRLIAEGMISAQESIAGDIDTLLGCIGDEYLNEDELEAQIEKLQAQCEQYEKSINTLRLMNFYMAGLNVSGVIKNYQSMIENKREEIAVLQEKLIFLHEAEDLTVNLFQLVMDSLTTVQNVIRDAGVNVRGGDFPEEPGWLTELDDIEELEEMDDFESDLIKQGFPEGYIKYLLILHEEYPEWKFEAVMTGIDYKAFADFQESSKNKCADISYIPNYCLPYDFEGEIDIKYHDATKEAIYFFMNPYSMLQLGTNHYTNAMQFLKADQKLPEAYIDKVLPVILGTEDEDIIEAIKNAESCVNPVFMATIYSEENGPKGEIYKGKPVYNFFNIGANSGGGDALQYAYEQGWYTLEDCLKGSEEVFRAYINRGQDTLYALDWDFMSYMNDNNLKQYSTLVNDAENKAISMCKRGDVVFDLHYEFSFKIPVYENIITYGDEEFGALPDPNHVTYSLGEDTK